MTLRLAAALALAAASCAPCDSVCPTQLTFTLVDDTGAAVTSPSGTITPPSVGALSFNCSGAIHQRIVCQGNTLIVNIESGEPASVPVSVTAGGKSFTGSVSPTWATLSGAKVCGSDCREGTATVTLR